jgi:hypothetical protein
MYDSVQQPRNGTRTDDSASVGAGVILLVVLYGSVIFDRVVLDRAASGLMPVFFRQPFSH